MAQQSFPFEGLDTTESQFSKWARNFQETGVQGSPDTSGLSVTAEGSTLSVNLAAGQAFIRGHYYINTTSLALPITLAGVNTRIDFVVLELDPTANTIIAKVIEGTAVSSDPVAPTLTQTDDGVYQLPVAKITIPNSTLAITNEMIEDVRTFMGHRIGIWTTATRPANPLEYQTIGYNTTINAHEVWNGTGWVGFADPISTRGDVIIGGENGVPERLPVGEDGQVIATDGTDVFWADVEAKPTNFVIDFAGSSNNSFELADEFGAGVYLMSFDPVDTSYDIYLVAADGSLAGYSSTSSIVATKAFNKVSVIGIGNNTTKVSFTNVGSEINTADTNGTIIGAGAYLTAISDTDLPTIGDTTILTGGNFDTDVEVIFYSGLVEEPAAAIVRNSATELLVTRPTGLVANLNPWSVKVINPGVPEPTKTNSHIITGITGGQGVTWVTASDLGFRNVNSSFTVQLEATDGDGGDVDYQVIGSLPSFLSLNLETGLLTATNITADATFTVRAIDDGGSYADRTFSFIMVRASGGTITYTTNHIVHTFNASGTFSPLQTLTTEYIVVAGGGGGSAGAFNSGVGLGGGAGGLRSSIPGFLSGGGAAAQSPVTVSNNQTVTVGAGGAGKTNTQAQPGSGSAYGSITTNGGGAANDGSGGSGAATNGQGASGQGFNGGNVGGGGAGAAGNTSPTALEIDGVLYAGGGISGSGPGAGSQGIGPGGGGYGGTDGGTNNIGTGGTGTAGIVIVRYAR